MDTAPLDAGTTGFSDTPGPPGLPDAETTPDLGPTSPDSGAVEDVPNLPDVAAADTGQVEDAAVPPSQGKLVITEIMYDPKSVDDDFGEWIEVYNAGAEAIDLSGWTLRDNGSNHHVITSALPIPAGTYAVLGRSGDSQKNGGAPVDYQYSDFYLSNAADSVVLVDPSGTIADEVSYQTVAPWPVKVAGVSIELIDPTLDNALGKNWTGAVVLYGDGDKGTPGAANGQPEPAFEIDGSVEGWQSPVLHASLRFSPFDDVEPWLLELLDSAQSQVRLAYFNIRLPAVKWALVDLAQAGVDVKVILDQKQQDLDYNTMADELQAEGIAVVLVQNDKAEKATMHHKFAVIDSELVVTGSANLSSTALNKSDEDILAMRSPDIANRYLAEFAELEAGTKAKSAPYEGEAPIKVWMGPEDDLDGKVLTLLDSAQETVLVAMFQINQAGLIQKLIDIHNAGKTVIVVLDDLHKAAGGAEVTLANAGVTVILAQNTQSQFSEMHSKLLIIDQTAMAMGSFNWTNLASFHNDESLAVITDSKLISRATGKFAELIKSYSVQSAADLGLVTTDQQVTIELTNLSLDPGAVALLQPIGGDTDWSEAKTLDGTSLTVTMSPGQRLEYRFGVSGPTGTFWETGQKHFFTVPYAAGPFVVSDSFK